MLRRARADDDRHARESRIGRGIRGSPSRPIASLALRANLGHILRAMPDMDTAQKVLERQALDQRNRAEELRTVAENTRNAAARRVLLDLAREADQMAARIEAGLKALWPGQPSN
jgi:hypothetical protein